MGHDSHESMHSEVKIVKIRSLYFQQKQRLLSVALVFIRRTEDWTAKISVYVLEERIGENVNLFLNLKFKSIFLWLFRSILSSHSFRYAKDSKSDGHFEINYFKVVECELHLAKLWLRLERGPVMISLQT